MAVYTPANADSRIQDYLYELNENLTYMFNNLSPEDNYSEDARLVYVQRGQQIGQLEVRADGIEAKVSDDEKNYNTSIKLMADLLSLNASTPEGSSSLSLTGDKITLKTGKFTVDAKNLKIDEQGNGTFSGTVSAAKIEGGSMNATTITGGSISATKISGTDITGGSISGTNIDGGKDIPFKARKGYVSIGDFEVDDSYGRHIFQSSDEVTGMSTGDVSDGELYLWAGWGQSSVGDAIFLVSTGSVRINKTLYYKGQTLKDYIEEIAGKSS